MDRPLERTRYAMVMGVVSLLASCGVSGNGIRFSRDAGEDFAAATDVTPDLSMRDSLPDQAKEAAAETTPAIPDASPPDLVHTSDGAGVAIDTSPDVVADGAGDLPFDRRPDLVTIDTPVDSSSDVGPRDLPLRDSAVDSAVDGRPETPPVRDSAIDSAVDGKLDTTAVDSAVDGRLDTQLTRDSGDGGGLCVGTIAVCGGSAVNTSNSSSHCGGCDSPCLPGSVCSHGICESGTSNWPTIQHDVQHTGENMDELGGPPLCLAWSRTLSASTALSPPVVADGRLFVTSAGRFAQIAPIYALNASDGSDLWQYNFGDVDSVGYPSVFAGSVYLANGQATNVPARLWAMDAASGAPQWVAPLNAQWEQYWAPIQVGGIVYTNAGTYGGMYGMAAADGSQVFFQSLDQYDEWSPAFFASKIFTFIAGNFRKHDPATGAVLTTVIVPYTWNGYSMHTVPVFGSQFAYVIAPPSLIAIDPSSDSIAWTAGGAFAGTPAFTDGTVYGISGGTLQARDGATGALLWTFVGDSSLSFPPVTAGGYLYVASAKNVYAVRLATHAQVWTDAVGGWLAVAAHRLFVAGAGGTISAYTLSF